MKAARINQYGGSEVIEIKETEKPKLENGEVLVEVFASSINPIDYKIRKGNLSAKFPDPNLVTLGTDFAGKIIEVAGDVSDFNIGDEVYGNASILNGGSGAIAQMAMAKAGKTALKPKILDFINSAALPLVATSAIQAIEEHINIQKGQKILIQGGSGGIGSMAIQIAKMHGAFVAATASGSAIEFVKSLGADLVIDYKEENFLDMISDYDAVFDTANGETVNKSLKVLRKGGILVSMGAPIDQDLAKELSVTGIAQSSEVTKERLVRIAELIDSGKIKVEVDKIFNFEKVKEAFDYAEDEHPKGKVVIKII